MDVLALIALAMAVAGLAQAGAGWLAARRFAVAPRAARRSPRPPMTILKPLCGEEPMLEQALATACAQDYPVLSDGLRRAATRPTRRSPCCERVRARFPDRDIALVVDPAEHGENRKIGNLINMLPAARHDLLVIADSDVHAPPDYLAGIADTLGAARHRHGERALRRPARR